MKKNVADDIMDAFNEILSEYESNHHIVFESDAVRRKLHYGAVNSRLTVWKKKRRCIYTGCEKHSLKRSHTIPKTASLAIISECSEILTPEFDHKAGRIEMKRRGLAWASTFPGFCPEHESLFIDFEQKRGFQTDQHVALQIYRSLCREIVRKRIEIQTGEKDLTAYEKKRDTRLLYLIEEKLGPKLMREEKISMKSLHFQDPDPITKPACDFLAHARTDLKTLEDEHLGMLESAIRDPTQVDISPIVVKIDALIPVALAGLGVFNVLDLGRRHRVLVIVNVIPFDGQTVLLMYGKPQDDKYVRGYLGNRRDTISILNMIESWMIHGTDHWFIRPSVWASIPSSRQRAILDAIADVSKNIGDDPDYSIFDQIRRAQIASGEDLLAKGKGDTALTEILTRERQKLI